MIFDTHTHYDDEAFEEDRDALISSLLTCISQRKAMLSSPELENVCLYVSRFPADFASLFFRGLLRVEDMNMKLAAIASFLEWMKKNKRFL